MRIRRRGERSSSRSAGGPNFAGGSILSARRKTFRPGLGSRVRAFARSSDQAITSTSTRMEPLFRVARIRGPAILAISRRTRGAPSSRARRARISWKDSRATGRQWTSAENASSDRKATLAHTSYRISGRLDVGRAGPSITRTEHHAEKKRTAPQHGSFRNGDEGTRTPDILLAKQALYQLSYVPAGFWVRRDRAGRPSA